MNRKLYVILLTVCTFFYITVCVASEPYFHPSIASRTTIGKCPNLTQNDHLYLKNPFVNFSLSGMKFKADFGFTNEATTKVENDSVFPLDVNDETVYSLSVGYMNKPPPPPPPYSSRRDIFLWERGRDLVVSRKRQRTLY